MGAFEVGVVLMTGQAGPERITQRWSDLKAMALRAEEIGFDTVWAPDELLWRPEGRPQFGAWEGIAMMAALAASTQRIKIGSWVISALHRNAGITSKAVETIDEISDGRFVFGLGAGHAWPGQAHAFGLPEDRIFDRFEEALQVIVPMLREGHADFEGEYHQARNLDQLPVGPRPGKIPLMIGALLPRGMRLAARYADVWSCYADERSDLTEFGPRLEALKAACDEVGRDYASIGKSAGINIKPLEPDPAKGEGSIAGSPQQIAAEVLAFREAGYDHVEFWPVPFSMTSIEALAPILELVRAS